MNFKSNAAYKKWLAYGHASGEFAKTPGNQPVSIKGQSHKVKHEMGGNMYAAGGSFNNKGFKSLPANVQQKIKQNSMGMGGTMPVQNPYNMNVFTDGIAQNFAFGGNMRSYAAGGMLDNQLTEFNNGGRHEENPIGGIPQGFAPGGQVNLVEQGETKLNSANYIFSDTLKVTKDIALDYGLSKDTVGKTFAEVSKKLNRPTSRRENDTIEEVAKQRDLDNLMQAQEDFKQRDLQKDIDMMAEKHPEFMQQMMGQGQQQVMDQQLMNQGVPPQELIQMQGNAEQGMPQEAMMQTPQSVQPMGMPQGMPVDPNQIPPEMLAQMPEAQMGQPVMAYGGHMYKCGGKMYNFGGNMYANGGRMYGDGGFFQGMGNVLQSVAPIAGQALNTVIPGSSVVVSGALSGLGAGLQNVGTGADFKEVAKDVGIGAAKGAIGGIVPGKDISKLGQLALDAAPQVMDVVGNTINANTDDASEMNLIRQQEALNAPKMVSGYNMSPTPMQMKYGGYKAQAPWHNFPQYTPNYPGNAGPMYMGLGTNLFAAGGMMMGGPGDPPGPGDGVATTTPIMMDNPVYDQQYNYLYIPVSKKGGNTSYSEDYIGNTVKGAGLTRLATPKEMELLKNNWLQTQRSRLAELYPRYKAGNLPQEELENFYLNYNYFPTEVYTPPIPEGEPETYYQDNINRIFSNFYGVYPKPPKQIEDPFANFQPTLPKKELQYVTNYQGATSIGGDQRMADWGVDPTTGQPAPMYRLANTDVPGHSSYGFNMGRGKNYAEVQENLYKEYNDRLQKAMGNFGAEVLAETDPNYSSNYYIDNPQLLQEGYNTYMNNPEWLESLTPEDRARYVVPDYSNIPLYANQAGEELYIPLKTGENTWKYKGQEYDYDPYLQQNSIPKRNGGPMRLNTMYSPDLTYAAKMGGQLYNYGGGLKSPLMPLPVGNFIKYDEGGKIVQGAGSDPYQYKLENGKYYTAKKGTNAWSEVLSTNKTAYDAVKALVDAAPSDFKDIMETNMLAEQTGELEAPVVVENKIRVLPDVEITAAKEEALNDMQTAENPQEYLDAVEKYKSVLKKESEKLTDANADLAMKQGLASGLAMAIPAAYNLGAGIFGKAQQLDYRDYMIPEDITPYEYNINPQLSAANQTYAQAQDAFRNASMGGGDYMANMQQLANSRNQTIGELYANKQNLDAAQIQAAKTANKEIQTANLERKMGIEDFNRLSKAAKVELLKTGLGQLADIGKNAESKKLDLAYIKAVAPELSGNISYSSLGEQFLEFLKKQKESTSTSTSNKTE